VSREFQRHPEQQEYDLEEFTENVLEKNAFAFEEEKV